MYLLQRQQRCAAHLTCIRSRAIIRRVRSSRDGTLEVSPPLVFAEVMRVLGDLEARKLPLSSLRLSLVSGSC